MADRSRQYWFRAKRYGYGWSYPLTWQGWVAFFLFFSVLFVAAAAGPSLAATAILFIDITALLAVSFKYGEPAKWRWGKKK
jgi:hypothetical protein